MAENITGLSIDAVTCVEAAASKKVVRWEC